MPLHLAQVVVVDGLGTKVSVPKAGSGTMDDGPCKGNL